MPSGQKPAIDDRRLSAFDYERSLAACATGDRAALRELYEREARWLMGVVMRIVRNRELAEEVLQEAFLQIWRAAGTFDPARGSGRGWIYTVVRHRALEEVRRAQAEIRLDPIDLADLADAAQAAVESAAGSTTGSAATIGVSDLEHCLQQLEARKRTCIVHAFVEGYTHEQIARSMGTPLGTVKAWIRRGLLSLRECLS